MIAIQEKTLERVKHLLFEEAKVNIAKMLHNNFPYEFYDLQSAQTFTEEAYEEMRKYPIEDSELPYWCLIAVLSMDQKFHEEKNMALYLRENNAKGRVKTLYQFLAQKFSSP